MKEEKRENVGYFIKESMKIGSLEIVLGEKDDQNSKKYVTWQCRNGNDYNHGHYYDNELDAKADFCQRGLQEIAYSKSFTPEKNNHEK